MKSFVLPLAFIIGSLAAAAAAATRFATRKDLWQFGGLGVSYAKVFILLPLGSHWPVGLQSIFSNQSATVGDL